MKAEVISGGQTTCPYCGVGCGIDAKLVNGAIKSVNGTQDHPANEGRLCVKGSALHETLGLEGRLLHPKIAGVRTDWDSALDHISASLKKIIAQHGPDSVAFYLSGQLLTEDYYVANKLMKGFIGTANVDTNSRLCMASAVVAHKRAFGSDSVPCNYEDLSRCDLLVLIGSNAAWTHPVLYQRISAAKTLRPQMKIVVIDPRRTATCDIADLHLQIKPGADAFLFNGLLNYLAEKKALDREFIQQYTEGFESTLSASESYDLDTVALHSGLDIAELEQFYKWFARTPKSISFFSQGINQSATGTDKCSAIINCHLATGRIGKEGMGPFSITGQPNAMGGREVGGLANQLAAHMDFDETSIERVQRFWGAPNIARSPGLKAVELFDAIHSGKIKAVWIMATNPVVSLPDSESVREALAKCELVIVSDCIEKTDTNAFADVLLPATGWSEKDGSVTNSERRISRQRGLVKPSGEAKHDWWIICEVAKRLGFQKQFDYGSPRDIFVEHAALSTFENGGTRHFDIGALASMSQQQYDSMIPIQWPVNATNPQGTARLFTDNQYFTPNKKARFVAISATLPAQMPRFDTPFILNTGRLRDQWHTMTRTGLSPRLLSHARDPFVAINPRDAQSLGVREGELVRLFNHDTKDRRQSVLLTASIDASVADEQLFTPIHWSDQFASNARIAKLISPITDEYSGQPEFKFSRVGLKSVQVSLWLSVISRTPIQTQPFEFWTKTPIPGGWHYLLADTREENDGQWQEWIAQTQNALDKIELSNPIMHDYRTLACNNKRIDVAIFASPKRENLPDLTQLQAFFAHEVNADSWRLLERRENSSLSQSRIICSCFQVNAQQIRAAIDNGAHSISELGETLRCGTNCGSCIPEIAQLLPK